jgi:hypothetical protein
MKVMILDVPDSLELRLKEVRAKEIEIAEILGSVERAFLDMADLWHRAASEQK